MTSACGASAAGLAEEAGGFDAQHGLPLAPAGDFTSFLKEQTATDSLGFF